MVRFTGKKKQRHMTPTGKASDIPQAALRPERWLSWAWLIPLLALCFAGWLGYRSWLMRGIVITVQLDQGHGLEPGDDVRYRGIAVGRVRSVDLADDLGGIVVTAALYSQAPRLARAGTRIWVVRPKLGVTGIAGLETLVGPRYLAMLPGEGPPQRHFLGLSDAPIVESIEPGDLEIVLQATRRGGVQPGAPVLYRQVPVGTVLSVGLTSDGGAVEARVHVRRAYTQLIRNDTRFWEVGGVNAQLGIGGMSVEIESIDALLSGGVALATPPDAGEVVRTGHRFRLEPEPQDEWLAWEPLVVIASSFLPSGAVMPAPMRAVIGWKQGRWIKSERSRRGWVLQTDRGLLGPVDLLQVADTIDRESVVLEVAGRTIPLTLDPAWTDGRLALLDVQVTESHWPGALRRATQQPEDCLAVADPAAPPLPLAAARLTLDDRSWVIDPAVSVDEAWHGACVLARSDGLIVGMILVEEEVARVALLSEE
ncbi:MAG: MlaD family protein [Phycisphaerae bacterium]